MKVRLSKLATLEYREIIFNLADQYGGEKAIQFEIDLEAKREQLRKFPFSFGTFYETKKRKFLVNPYITVIYIVNENLDCVEILNFWFNRSNPEVLLKHL
jgi:plasmid stabilization system protein ParE